MMVPLVALHVLTTLFLAQSLHRCSSCQVRSCSNLRRRIDRSGCAVGRLWLQSDCENTGWNVPRASSHAIAAICSSAARAAGMKIVGICSSGMKWVSIFAAAKHSSLRSEKRMAGRQSRSDFDATAHTECMHATLSKFPSS
jgi:hypothetical protein